MEALQIEKKQKIKHWTDLWFSEYKKAGYVAITDFKKQLFYGLNDVPKVIAATEGKKGQYISLNAFNVDFKSRDFSRETARLKQIRNIGIDIDQYKMNLSVEEGLQVLRQLIKKNIIPAPNLVLTSRGIQLFYSIDQGAAPNMAWLARFITEQFINKLHHIGADQGAKDISRVLRVPNSVHQEINVRVKSNIWNEWAYTLQELQSYCRPLDKFNSRKKIQIKDFQLSHNLKLELFYRTNYARQRDLERLIELRKGDLTSMRNTFLYIYSFHAALVANTQTDLIRTMENTFKDTYSKTAPPLSKSEFERTVKSAYKAAEQFFNHFIENDYRIIYKQSDGIIKPYTSSNLIDKLQIQPEEQMQMRSLRNEDIERQQNKERMRAARQSAGMKTLQEYNEDRKQKKSNKLQQVRDLLANNPDIKKTEIARELGISRNYLYKLLKQL